LNSLREIVADNVIDFYLETQERARTLIYLASPYSHPKPSKENKRFRDAARFIGTAFEKELFIYSPIVHCHPPAVLCALDGTFDFWQDYNERMIEKSDVLWVLTLMGWKSSKGVQHEIAFAQTNATPVHYAKPIPTIEGSTTRRSRELIVTQEPTGA